MRSLSFLLLVLSLAGCKASFSADVNAGEKSKDVPPPPLPSQDIAANHPAQTTSFIGVSHALALSEDASVKATCRCMAALVGEPQNQAFQWRGTPPTVGDDALVLAIGNEKTPCDASGTFRGPSIRGIETEGNTVTVYLEEPRPGIPVARGAIFQRPLGDGVLVFRARRNLPYGQPLSGSGTSLCQIPLGSSPLHTEEASHPSPHRTPNAPVNTF